MSADFILFWFRSLPWDVWHAWGVVVHFCARDGRNLLGSGLNICGYVCIEVPVKCDTQATYVDRLKVFVMCQVVLDRLLNSVAGTLYFLTPFQLRSNLYCTTRSSQAGSQWIKGLFHELRTRQTREDREVDVVPVSLCEDE
jgi:hypothetical protein